MNTSIYPTIQSDRLWAILHRIEADPSCHRQDVWHCGTAHCFGGWAQLDAGHEANNATVRRDARVWLGLTEHEANTLFDSNNTRGALRAIVERFAAPDYPSDGFDGYDSDGYDSDGYDCTGRDRFGRDRDGRDRDGLDCSNNPRT